MEGKSSQIKLLMAYTIYMIYMIPIADTLLAKSHYYHNYHYHYYSHNKNSLKIPMQQITAVTTKLAKRDITQTRTHLKNHVNIKGQIFHLDEN
ncbi:MAG TPA: hypothetical protein VI278_00790 [Nitrososphaeraceae archaeon]|jgi:hypothetical protein